MLWYMAQIRDSSDPSCCFVPPSVSLQMNLCKIRAVSDRSAHLTSVHRLSSVSLLSTTSSFSRSIYQHQLCAVVIMCAAFCLQAKTACSSLPAFMFVFVLTPSASRSSSVNSREVLSWYVDLFSSDALATKKRMLNKTSCFYIIKLQIIGRGFLYKGCKQLLSYLLQIAV